jgi:hypothetical protein
VKKKTSLFFERTAKGSHPVRNKEPSPVAACIENAVTEKCHKEGYVEQRAYFYLLRKPAVFIRCNELLANFNVTCDLSIFMLYD